MAYVFELRPLIQGGLTPTEEACDCQTARRGCRPMFVFSISGQVGFRQALSHLLSCRAKECRHLRRRVIQSFQQKLAWLEAEGVALGCRVIQTTLASKHTGLRQGARFSELAKHLSRCPDEACAQLRRALLLTVRTLVGEQASAADEPQAQSRSTAPVDQRPPKGRLGQS